MKTLLVVALVLVFATPAVAGDWTVTYGIRGDISQVTQFYGPGAYEFLYGPNYITVYLKAEHWDFIGMYAEPALGYPKAELPESFPQITFIGAYDQAVVVPVSVTAVPELAILTIPLLHSTGVYRALSAPLQRMTAWSAAKLLGATSRGVFVVLPKKILEVEEWCSGLFTMKWLALLALCLVLLLLAVAWWLGLAISLPRYVGYGAAMILAALVIGFEVNVLRVAGVGAGYDKHALTTAAPLVGAAQVLMVSGWLGWWVRRRNG